MGSSKYHGHVRVVIHCILMLYTCLLLPTRMKQHRVFAAAKLKCTEKIMNLSDVLTTRRLAFVTSKQTTSLYRPSGLRHPCRLSQSRTVYNLHACKTRNMFLTRCWTSHLLRNALSLCGLTPLFTSYDSSCWATCACQCLSLPCRRSQYHRYSTRFRALPLAPKSSTWLKMTLTCMESTKMTTMRNW